MYIVQEHVKIGDAALHAILKASNGDMRKGERRINTFITYIMEKMQDGLIHLLYAYISAYQL